MAPVLGVNGELKLWASCAEIQSRRALEKLVHDMVVRGRHRDIGQCSHDGKLGASMNGIMG